VLHLIAIVVAVTATLLTLGVLLILLRLVRATLALPLPTGTLSGVKPEHALYGAGAEHGVTRPCQAARRARSAGSSRRNARHSAVVLPKRA
jgi:hypothetical protein